MRFAALCVFFALTAHKKGIRAATDDDFRPTPIPLEGWRPVKQDAPRSLHEIIKTETPPMIAALPARYWEDALRHSVYLTLVRDKIDQLIAKTGVISDDNPNRLSKDVDDHDLWEKVKSAPFDRLMDVASPTGDSSILAKGRLVVENDGFRFAEDEATRKKCDVNNCTEDVKAFWSVKRVRQRDAESSTGRYHYELTFSVTSHTPQKLKPLENPVRTFTVKESAPIDPPPVYRPYEAFHRQPSRPQRAIWVHKNIAPAHNYRARQSTSNLDRIFTSFFSDEDNDEEQQHRFKPNTYVPQMHPPYSNFEHRETYHQKMIPFPAQTPYKYSRPSFQLHSSPPYIHHPYFNMDSYVNNPLHADDTFTSNTMKTTRPAVLPTPVAPTPLIRESTVEVPVKTLFNITDYPTKPTEAISTYKMYKQKQHATKISYTPENVRPPVYSAPPGVFVTMDKKPFKPMPPMKLVHSSIPAKLPPLDFRPSMQVLGTQFSNSDSAPDTAFRPITINSNEDVYNKKVIIDSAKKGNKDIRKPSPNKKPQMKQDRIKMQRITTVAPEIITVQDDDDIDIEWTTLLGAFSKTTPMASQKEKATTTESNTLAATAIASVTTEQTDPEDTNVEYTLTTPIPTSTTPMPKKRTRPPPIFKQEKKVKKHKRVTTTTTSTTTTTPPTKSTVPESTEDLTPQASSAPTSGANSVWETTKQTESINLTTSANTNETLTTIRPSTTTYLTTSSTTLTTTVETKPPTARPGSKNRFRQSTVMQKGTSANHNKWFSPTLEKNKTTTSSEKLYMRRKVSKFHGYNSSTTPRIMEEEENKDHENHVFNAESEINSTESYKDDTVNTITPSTQTSIDENGENNDTATDSAQQTEKDDSNAEYSEENVKENYVRESNDDSEFIFQINSTAQENLSTVSDTSHNAMVEPTTVTSQHLAVKNKTKCKKKKHNNLTTIEHIPETSGQVFDNTMTSTEKVTEKVTPDMRDSPSTTPDILEELFGGFTMDGNENDEPKPSPPTTEPDTEGRESIKHERYIGDDTVDRFLESLEVKGNHQVNSDEQTENDYDESSDISIEDNPFDNDDDEDADSREAHYDEYYEDKENQGSRPYSLLELMAME